MLKEIVLRFWAYGVVIPWLVLLHVLRKIGLTNDTGLTEQVKGEERC